MALLEVKNLHTYFETKKRNCKGRKWRVLFCGSGKDPWDCRGESGSGKSVSAMSIIKLLDGNGYIADGEVWFDGENLVDVPIKDMINIRGGNDISVIFQEPMTSLNPVFTVERQVSEPLMIHQGMDKEQAAEKVIEMLSLVKIPNPEAVTKQYPHQLSGGNETKGYDSYGLSLCTKIINCR